MTNWVGQSKYAVFTENTNPDEFREKLQIISQHVTINYICGQIEIASTGHRHFQGYVQLTASRTLTFYKNNISSTAHFIKQSKKATNEQARDYTKKVDETTVPDTFVEYGDFTPTGSPGTRSDIHALRDAIIKGKDQRTIIEDDYLVETFAKYVKFADRVRLLYPPKRDREEDFKVSLYYGSPGTGKTRKAVEENPELFEIPITNGTLWFDGYDNHEVVLFDDFMGRSSKISLDNTLKFFDRYTRKVPVKGTHVWFKPNHIIVTSNYHPRDWYKWEGRSESWAALKRRFHEVYVFHSDGSIELQDSVEDFMEDRDLWPSEMIPPIGGDGVTYFK